MTVIREELLGNSSDAAVIVDTAVAAAEPSIVETDKLYTRVVPAGASQEVIDLERFLPAPRRARGTVHLQTVGAFVRYVERHDAEQTTTLWVDADTHKVIAVFNDHSRAADAGAPGWGDHRAELRLQLTDAWRHWLAQDGKLLDQEAFAEHIEDGLIDIVEPDGAHMLEVAQSIQGTTRADFKQARRLSDGQVGIEYVEEQTATAGQRGDLEIPERFVLGVAPFVGEDAYRVEARLRYRIRGGDLRLGYRLDRPGDVLRDAVDGIADRLGQQFTLERVFVGSPRP